MVDSLNVDKFRPTLMAKNYSKFQQPVLPFALHADASRMKVTLAPSVAFLNVVLVSRLLTIRYLALHVDGPVWCVIIIKR